MRFLFTTHPLPSHFFPMVPLARALEQAGHTVAVATPRGFHGALEGLGFEALAAGPDWDNDPTIRRVQDEMLAQAGPEHMPIAVQSLFLRAAGIPSLPEIEAVVEAWEPDAIVSEVTDFAAPAVAERRGLPFARVLFGMEPPHALAPVVLGEAYQELRRAAGLEPDPDFDKPFGTPLQLCFAPRSYQPPEVPLSPTTHMLRPEPFDRLGDEGLPTWIHELSGRPTVYATLGTVFAETPGVFEAIIDGLAEEDVDVIATVGSDGDPERLRGRARNLRVERYIPNSLLLPHCDAVVAHAGYGTVMGALVAGLPVVLLPLGADQFLHAGRCRDLEVGLVLEGDAVSPESMRAAVRRILDEPAFGENARRLRDEIAAMPDVHHAVALLERLVKSGRPIVREGDLLPG